MLRARQREKNRDRRVRKYTVVYEFLEYKTRTKRERRNGDELKFCALTRMYQVYTWITHVLYHSTIMRSA